MKSTTRRIKLLFVLLSLPILAACPGPTPSTGGEDDGDGGGRTPTMDYGTSYASVFQTLALDDLIPDSEDMPPSEVYRITPELPLGLVISSDDGTISGTPDPESDPSAIEYTVRAVLLEVDDDGIETEELLVDTTLTIEVLDDVAPSGLSYSLNPAVHRINERIAPNTPQFTGQVTSFAIDSSLPDGLALSSETGVITGSPREASLQADYVVTASNPFGNTQDTLRIEIEGSVLTTSVVSLHQDGTVGFSDASAATRLAHRTYRTVSSTPSSAASTPDGRFLFVGCDNGDIVRFVLSDGCSRPDQGLVVGNLLNMGEMLINKQANRLAVLHGGILSSIEILPDGSLGTEESADLGMQTYAMAINPSNDHVYVIETGSSLLSAHTLLPSLASVGLPAILPGYPAHIAVTFDGRHVYIADGTSDVLTVLDPIPDPQGGDAFVQVNSMNAPFPVAAIATTSEHLFVASVNGGGIVSYDLLLDGSFGASTLVEDGVSFIDMVPLPDETGFVCLDGESNDVYALDYWGYRRMRMQTRPGVTDIVVISGDPITVNTEWVLAADSYTDLITSLSIAYETGELTPSIQGAVPSGNDPVAVLMNEVRTSAYVANRSDDTVSRYAFDASTGALTNRTDTATGVSPSKLALDPSERFLFVMHEGTDTIQRLDIAPDGTLSRGPTTQLSIGALSTIKFHPAGRILYVVGVEGSIAPFLVDPATGDLTAQPVYETNGLLRDIEFPAEANYAYVSDEYGSLWQFSVDPSSGALTPLVPAVIGTGSTSSQMTVSRRLDTLRVANPENGTVSLFLYDRVSGLLEEDTFEGPVVSVGDNPMEIAYDAGSVITYIVTGDGLNASLHVWMSSNGVFTEMSTFGAGQGPVAIFPDSGRSD